VVTDVRAGVDAPAGVEPAVVIAGGCGADTEEDVVRRLEGRTAVVTGAGSGIGAASAVRLAAEGATVVVTDVDEPQAIATAKEIAEAGGTASSTSLDVTDRDAIQAVFDRVVREHGRLDIVHNNAGFGSITPMQDIDAATAHAMLEVNVMGVFNGLAVAGPIMAAAGRGSIINSSSAAANYGAPNQVFYAGTKGAVLAMTRGAAMELAPSGVRVNAICPGGVRTGFWKAAIGAELGPEMLDAGARAHPMRRWGAPSEVAAVVAFLASDDASLLTGVGLPVDGGLTAGAVVDFQ
jgi:NAD(P)-dependent dehydrogenase (short-subunit alcohol dehydrogenase family)